MNEIDKIALIQTRNGQILSTKSKGRTKYYIPGGKREAGETDEQTLIREIKEELNVQIKSDTIQYMGTFRAQSDHAKKGVIVKMTCYEAAYEGTPEASSEIEEIRWLNYRDMDLISHVDKKIFTFLKERGDLE